MEQVFSYINCIVSRACVAQAGREADGREAAAAAACGICEMREMDCEYVDVYVAQ